MHCVLVQSAGAGVLLAVPGRGRGGRAARVPLAGAQDGALRARAAAARHVARAQPQHRRAAHAARRRRARQRGTYTPRFADP